MKQRGGSVMARRRTLAGFLAVIAACAMGPDGLHAQARGVLWKCLQQEDAEYHVVCVPLPVEAPAPRRMPDKAAAAASAVTDPHSSVLSGVAERGLDEVFSAESWTIPLYARPSNPAAVMHLLDSALCASAPGCSVTYRFAAPAKP